MAAKNDNQLVVMPELKEGVFQPCQGYLMRRTKYLKRWRRQYTNIVPSKNHVILARPVQIGHRTTP